MATPDRNVLLLGGGHAHALVLRAFARRPLVGARVTLVSESSRFLYSGMLPGHVAGEHAREELEFDLERLAHAAGATFVEAQVVGLDPAARLVRLFGRDDLAYDFCSLNVGGSPRVGIPGGAAATPVKPVDGFLAEVRRIEAEAAKARRAVVVIGAGAGGVELAFALARRFGSRLSLTLVDQAAEPVSAFPARARRKVRALLAAQGVALELGSGAVRVENRMLALANGKQVAFDHLLGVTEAAPPEWLASSGLELSPDGRVLVDERLCSVVRPEVFAVGDVAVIANRPRPRAGVFAVRAAEPLERNLRAAVGGGKLAHHAPQSTFLSLISTVRGEALAVKGPVVLHGRLMKYLKDRIDGAFVAGFRDPAILGRERVVASARRT